MTLALYGKSRQRQKGLLLFGLMAIIVAALAGATMMKAERAGADSNTFAVSAASCVDGQVFGFSTTDNDPAVCAGANAAALSAGGATVNLERDDLPNGFLNGDLGTDDLTVSFNIASIPDSSTISAATLNVYSTVQDGAGTLNVGSSAGGSQYGSLAAGSPQAYTVTAGVQGTLPGNTFTVRLSMDCNPNSDDCGRLIDQVSLFVEWAPPADADGDGMSDAVDECDATGDGEAIHTTGCSLNDYIEMLNAGTPNAAAIAGTCQEANFSFVVDKSGSISDPEMDGQRGGIQSFVTTYDASATGHYALATFQGAGATLHTPAAYQLDAAFATTLAAQVDGAGSGATPTSAGIQAGDAPISPANAKQHMMFVITDGSPNIPDSSLPLTNPIRWVNAADAAINAANTARAASPNFIVNAIWVQTVDTDMPFDGIFGPGSNNAFADAVMDNIGGGDSDTVADFSGIASALLGAIDCQPPATANVIIGKVWDSTGAPADATTFSGTVGTANWSGVGFGQFSAPVSIPANTSVTADETSPTAGWSEVGWAAGTYGGSPTAQHSCPSDTATYTGNADINTTVGANQYSVLCVMNTKAPTGEVTIDKSDSTQATDGTITWTIGIHNSTGSTQTAYIADPGATLVSSTGCNPAATQAPGGVITCLAVPNGGAGGVAEATVTVTTSAAPLSPLEICDGYTRTNAAYLLASPTDEIDVPTDIATATIPGVADAGCLSVTKTHDGNGTWTITFTNTGPAAQINFSDTYQPDDTGTSIDLATSWPGSCDTKGTLQWSGCILNVPADGPASVTVRTTDFQCGTVRNDVTAYFGPGGPNGPGELIGTDFDTRTEDECTHIIQVCKVWETNGPLNGDVNFTFETSDSSEEIPATQLHTIFNVTEGGDPECILLEVSPGLVTIDELVPAGFVMDGWIIAQGDSNSGTLQLGGTPDASFNVPGDICNIRAGEQLIRDIAALVIEVPDGEPLCTITFFNHDDGVTLNSGNIRVEKYRDINGDGDADDAGEGLLDGWDMTIAGPGPNETQPTSSAADATFGTFTWAGLISGDVYTITEETRAGWTVTNATVDGVSVGAVTVVGASVPNGGDRVVRFYNQERNSINIHKEAQTRHNGITSPAPNDDDGWTFTLDSEDCGVHFVGVTDSNGNLSFTGLPLCTDYVVAEVGPNASSPGFVIVSPASGNFTGQTPEGQTLTFLNRRTTNDPPCQNCGQTTPTTTPTTPTATPTTPTTTTTPTATNTPTSPTTPASPSPSITNIAGDRTPGPGQTPIAPSAGNGLFGEGGSSLNIVLLLAGLVAITSGLGFVALGRKGR